MSAPGSGHGTHDSHGDGLRVAAVIPAGGRGRRMGERKQFLELAGVPVLLRALQPFLDHPLVSTVVVALPAEDAASPPSFLPESVLVVAGGEERGDSVRAALAAVPDSADVVLVHDAARPLVTREVIDRVLEVAATGTAALAAVPVADTLKRVDADGVVRATVDRAGLWRAQTPQGFPRGLLAEAHARAADEGLTATDDAGLVERLGGRVVVVEGSARNIKITRPEDMELALRLLPERSP